MLVKKLLMLPSSWSTFCLSSCWLWLREFSYVTLLQGQDPHYPLVFVSVACQLQWAVGTVLCNLYTRYFTLKIYSKSHSLELSIQITAIRALQSMHPGHLQSLSSPQHPCALELDSCPASPLYAYHIPPSGSRRLASTSRKSYLIHQSEGHLPLESTLSTLHYGYRYIIPF